MEKKTEKRSFGRAPIHVSVSFEFTERETGRFVNVIGTGTGVDISLPADTEVMWSAPADGKFRVGLRFLC